MPNPSPKPSLPESRDAIRSQELSQRLSTTNPSEDTQALSSQEIKEAALNYKPSRRVTKQPDPVPQASNAVMVSVVVGAVIILLAVLALVGWVIFLYSPVLPGH